MLLLLGALLTFLAHLRWGIGLLAWIAPVPWLAYLRAHPGRRARAALAGTVVATWIVTTFKIFTAPLPVFAPVAFGIVIGVFQLLPLLGWDLARRRLSPRAALIAYPTLMVAFECLQARTPVASWGALAYTQLGDLPLLQLASLGGTAAIGFLIAWVAATVEHGLATRRWRPLAVAGATVLAAHAFGVLRLASAEDATPSLRVAAVVTDATFGGPPVPSADELARIDDVLIERTRIAARAGARIVVWPEAATLVWSADEPAFDARLADLARAEHIDLVAAYVTPAGTEPLPFYNHYVWLRPDGSVATRYEKRHPVPGEPSIAGDALPAVIDTGDVRAAGVICYDGDFPSLTRAATADDVDLLLIPSSDWRGIDPIHTQMASLRAIEDGVSLLRSTRLGLSAGYDAYGRTHGQLSSFESDERILITTLPARRVWTLYHAIGDLPVLAAVIALLLLVVRAREGITGSESIARAR